MKKSLLALSLGAVLLVSTSCMNAASNESDRVAALLADTVCLASETITSMGVMDTEAMAKLTPEEAEAKMAELTAKGEEMKTKAEGLAKTHGFATDADAEKAFNNITDKVAFRATVEAKVKSKCTPNEDLMKATLDGAFGAM